MSNWVSGSLIVSFIIVAEAVLFEPSAADKISSRECFEYMNTVPDENMFKIRRWIIYGVPDHIVLW
jgi:hypothetical protein